MSRRKAPDNALSLFAFQDIITGTAGVMLFILMLLVVQLAIQSKSKASAKTSSSANVTKPSVSEPTVTTLAQADIDQLKKQRDQMTRWMVAEGQMNPETMLRKTGKLELELRNMHAQLAAAEANRNSMRTMQEARSSIERTREEKEQAMQGKIAQMESDLREIEQHPQIHFTLPEVRSGMFLIDVTDSAINVIEPTQLPREKSDDPLAHPPPERRKTTIPIGGNDDAKVLARNIQKALDVLNGKATRKELQCLLVIRPSAAGIANPLMDELTKNKNMSLALELLEADKEIGFWARVGKIQE
jgi:hypothetical protein